MTITERVRPWSRLQRRCNTPRTRPRELQRPTSDRSGDRHAKMGVPVSEHVDQLSCRDFERRHPLDGVGPCVHRRCRRKSARVRQSNGAKCLALSTGISPAHNGRHDVHARRPAAAAGAGRDNVDGFCAQRVRVPWSDEVPGSPIETFCAASFMSSENPQSGRTISIGIGIPGVTFAKPYRRPSQALMYTLSLSGMPQSRKRPSASLRVSAPVKSIAGS
jgi:hypothetical protein